MLAAPALFGGRPLRLPVVDAVFTDASSSLFAPRARTLRVLREVGTPFAGLLREAREVERGRPGPRDVERGRPGPREVERARVVPREVERGRPGPRDVERVRLAAREVERARVVPREVERARVVPREVERARVAPFEVERGRPGPREVERPRPRDLEGELLVPAPLSSSSTSLRVRLRPRGVERERRPTPRQLSLTHEVSLSFCGVESARKRARLRSVCSGNQKSDEGRLKSRRDWAYSMLSLVAPAVRRALVAIAFDAFAAASVGGLKGSCTFPACASDTLDHGAIIVMCNEAASICILDLDIVRVAPDAVHARWGCYLGEEIAEVRECVA